MIKSCWIYAPNFAGEVLIVVWLSYVFLTSFKMFSFANVNENNSAKIELCKTNKVFLIPHNV